MNNHLRDPLGFADALIARADKIEGEDRNTSVYLRQAAECIRNSHKPKHRRKARLVY